MGERTLHYCGKPAAEPDPGRRLGVAAAIAGFYVFIFLGVLSLPLLALLAGSDLRSSVKLMVAVAVLLICEAALLFIPIRRLRRRPISRRLLWFPLIASGLLAAVLVLGGTLALLELVDGKGSEIAVNIAFAIAGTIWCGWAILFYVISSRIGADAIGDHLYRWLLAGSILELLIAVPAHIVVRRRQECCGGMLTGIGIASGVGVMLVAFGPSVLFLYLRRWRQIRLPNVLPRPREKQS